MSLCLSLIVLKLIYTNCFETERAFSGCWLHCWRQNLSSWQLCFERELTLLTPHHLRLSPKAYKATFRGVECKSACHWKPARLARRSFSTNINPLFSEKPRQQNLSGGISKRMHRMNQIFAARVKY